MVGRVVSVELRHHDKFRGNRSSRCRDIAIFGLFKMAAVRHIGLVIDTLGPPTNTTW